MAQALGCRLVVRTAKVTESLSTIACSMLLNTVLAEFWANIVCDINFGTVRVETRTSLLRQLTNVRTPNTHFGRLVGAPCSSIAIRSGSAHSIFTISQKFGQFFFALIQAGVSFVESFTHVTLCPPSTASPRLRSLCDLCVWPWSNLPAPSRRQISDEY